MEIRRANNSTLEPTTNKFLRVEKLDPESDSKPQNASIDDPRKSISSNRSLSLSMSLKRDSAMTKKVETKFDRYGKILDK